MPLHGDTDKGADFMVKTQYLSPQIILIMTALSSKTAVTLKSKTLSV